MSDEWFSDEAQRKQAEITRLTNAGKVPPLELIFGMLEPRVQPTAEECCAHCGSDGREEVGGEEFNGKRWCSLCFGRDRHLDNADTIPFTGDTCPRCGAPADETYFDREICPEPCSTMHTRCTACGCAINGCVHDTGRLRRATG